MHKRFGWLQALVNIIQLALLAAVSAEGIAAAAFFSSFSRAA